MRSRRGEDAAWDLSMRPTLPPRYWASREQPRGDAAARSPAGWAVPSAKHRDQPAVPGIHRQAAQQAQPADARLGPGQAAEQPRRQRGGEDRDGRSTGEDEARDELGLTPPQHRYGQA